MWQIIYSLKYFVPKNWPDIVIDMEGKSNAFCTLRWNLKLRGYLKDLVTDWRVIFKWKAKQIGLNGETYAMLFSNYYEQDLRKAFFTRQRVFRFQKVRESSWGSNELVVENKSKLDLVTFWNYGWSFSEPLQA